MIKKYFALSLIAASIAMTGCSSNNDPAPAPAPAPAPNPNPTTTVTPGVGGTAYDTIVNSNDHSTLERAIIAAGLAAELDNSANAFTIFAPTNAAFEALDNDGNEATLTTAQLLEEGNRAALVRILRYHVVAGDVSSTALSQQVTGAGSSAATRDTLLVDGSTTQTIAFTSSTAATSGIAVNTVGVDRADVAPADGAVGRVHVLGSLLTPPAVVTTPPPTTGNGAVDTALATAGGLDIFRAAINRDFAGQLDTQRWTVFVPSDAVLGAAGLTNLTSVQQQNHIISDDASDATALAGLTSIRSSSNLTYPVATASGVTSVNGFAVRLIATGAGGAQIYSIAGVLTAP